MVVQELIDLVIEQTRDIDTVTWTNSDVYGYINEAVKNTTQRAPQANSKKELTACVTGIDQVLPVDAVSLINVVSNDADDASREGLPVYEVDVDMKDRYTPGWRRTRASSVVIEWMKRSMPTEFMVWPPLDADRSLNIEYSFYPSDVADPADIVSIHNDYNEPIRNWTLYRVFSRDAEDTPSVKRAEVYRAQYEAFFK